MSRRTIMTELIVCDLCGIETGYYKDRCGQVISNGKFIADLCPECKGRYAATIAPFLMTHFCIDSNVVPFVEEEGNDE